ncbi:hypothetical protein APASM_2716 [Actinosynnema pretiosum subsp. pretiosum]|nr:hypothetical protein APASM_2716 [Actinosynnema pretiosum subsp. pretiosum]
MGPQRPEAGRLRENGERQGHARAPSVSVFPVFRSNGRGAERPRCWEMGVRPRADRRAASAARGERTARRTHEGKFAGGSAERP